MTKDLVFTDTEEQNTLNAIHAFNQIILSLAKEFFLPVVNANAFMQPGGCWDAAAYKFALISQNDTAYSLDGINPNNYGHALIANELIMTINTIIDPSLPLLNSESYRGQYKGKQLGTPVLEMHLPRRKEETVPRIRPFPGGRFAVRLPMIQRRRSDSVAHRGGSS